jgi:HD-GYP domain-containing protein (c-di-GMP phosphodiesterase class II)
MKLVLASDKLIGEVLANPIYTESGIMYLNRGNNITSRAISMLKKTGVATVYIEDGNDEFDLQEVLATPAKFEAVKSLKAIYEEAKSREYINEIKVSQVVKEIMENMNLSENAVLISNLVPNDDISKLAIHSLDVATLCLMVGIRKKYDEKKIIKLGIAALLHDIGKLFTNDKKHVKKAQEILKRNPSIMSTTYMAIYYMYEREDGSGLFGAIGEKIHEFAKILGICNDYVNYISGENPMLPHVAIERITSEAVTKFSEEIYKDFLHSIYCYPNGLQVRLNNGFTGIVVMQNKGATTRPVLIVKNVEGYRFCNLLEAENLTLFIEEVII